MKHKPMLYIMIGAPGSGKSTFANKTFESKIDTIIVSRDNIRFKMLEDTDEYFAKEDKVFEAFYTSIADLLKKGIDVVADATHLHRTGRAKLINHINSIYADYYITFIYMDSGLSICLDRNSHREGRARVPDNVIKNMYCQIVKPTFYEFDNIIDIWTIDRNVLIDERR